MARRMRFTRAGTRKFGIQAAKDAGKLGAVALGTVASAKFLDFNQIFSNQPADSLLRKNQGLIKVGAAILLMPMIKNDMLKMVLLGVGVEGGIRSLRRFTTSAETGDSFFPQIGRGGNNEKYFEEYQKMMGQQFPGYGFTPRQVQEQLVTSVGQFPPGGTSPMTEVPMAVGMKW